MSTFKFTGTLIDGPEINVFHYSGIHLSDEQIETVLSEKSNINLIRDCPSVYESEIESFDEQPGFADSVYEYEVESVHVLRRELTMQMAEILGIDITLDKFLKEIISIITDTRNYSGMYVKNVTLPDGKEIQHHISWASGMASVMIESEYLKYFGEQPPRWLVDYCHPVQISKVCQLALDFDLKIPDENPT